MAESRARVNGGRRGYQEHGRKDETAADAEEKAGGLRVERNGDWTEGDGADDVFSALRARGR